MLQRLRTARTPVLVHPTVSEGVLGRAVALQKAAVLTRRTHESTQVCRPLCVPALSIVLLSPATGSFSPDCANLSEVAWQTGSAGQQGGGRSPLDQSAGHTCAQILLSPWVVTRSGSKGV